MNALEENLGITAERYREVSNKIADWIEKKYEGGDNVIDIFDIIYFVTSITNSPVETSFFTYDLVSFLYENAERVKIKTK